MIFADFREYCLAKKGVTENYPFNGEAAWLKVGGKVFAIASVEEIKVKGQIVEPFGFINLKCDPDLAVELRERHLEVEPGWHMNKTHWNSVHTTGDLSDRQILDMVDHSYDLVFNSLPKTKKSEILNS